MTQEIANSFESEITSLVKDYFSVDDFNKIVSHNLLKKSVNKLDERISHLYQNQLDIQIEEADDRFSLDRALTFAEKKLEPAKFYEFSWELGNVCKISGKLNLAQEIFNKITKRTTDMALKAKALIGLADIYSRKAIWTKSISLVTEAESIYKSVNDKAGIANCFNILGSISGEMGDIEKANNYFNQSLVFASETSAQDLNAKIETNLGVVNSILGNTDEAVKHLETALIIYRKANDLLRMAESYLNIGLNFLQAGDLRSAEAALNNGIEIAKENQFYNTLALLYHASSQVFIGNKSYLVAKEFSDKALSISHYLDDNLTIADIYKVRGIIAKNLNDTKTAESYLMISLRINTSKRNSLNVAEASVEIASLYKDEGKLELSKQYYLQAMDYYKKCNALDKIETIKESIKDLINHSDNAEVNDGQ